ncbi:carboxypeptidase-like regulatory domain-containing protein [Porphyromonas macacae]|uniref:carboxypeptidase-like regulatory domain-containing protein n=1 Tax=Porphyromonas macacae TaxID=28115 RepID=UPI000A71F611|nr:carboxypeptidase-like regulatory domain-containing protein [Porphyromonas macacae]
MKRFTLFFACLFLSIGAALAQQKVVSGIVISAEDNQPVIGASVIAKGFSGVGAQTDIDGKFSFTAPAAAKTIVVTYIGLQTQEVAISANMRIVMKPESKLLDEVVVVAYGTVRKQSMVGAQSSVSSKQLEKRPITNVSNALGGVAPGVRY